MCVHRERACPVTPSPTLALGDHKALINFLNWPKCPYTERYLPDFFPLLINYSLSGLLWVLSGYERAHTRQEGRA